MKSLTKDQKKKLGMIVAAALALIAGLWCGPKAYLTQKLEEAKGRITEQEIKVSNAERLVQSKEEIDQTLQTVSARLQEVEKTMASGDMYAWIITTVNKFRANHAKVEIPQFSREVTGDLGLLPGFPYKAATFTVRGTAFFHELGKFIADFENNFPYAMLTNLELEPVNGTAATSSTSTNSNPEQLAFKMDIVSLINPNPL